MLFLSVAKLQIFRLYLKIQSTFLLMDTSIIEITTPPPPPPLQKKKEKKRIDWVPATLARADGALSGLSKNIYPPLMKKKLEFCCKNPKKRSVILKVLAKGFHLNTNTIKGHRISP